MGADDTQIETSILRSNQNGEGQKSVSLQKRAEGKPGLTKLGARGPREKCGKTA